MLVKLLNYKIPKLRLKMPKMFANILPPLLRIVTSGDRKGCTLTIYLAYVFFFVVVVAAFFVCVCFFFFFFGGGGFVFFVCLFFFFSFSLCFGGCVDEKRYSVN